jgi:hypothetical protein
VEGAHPVDEQLGDFLGAFCQYRCGSLVHAFTSAVITMSTLASVICAWSLPLPRGSAARSSLSFTTTKRQCWMLNEVGAWMAASRSFCQVGVGIS